VPTSARAAAARLATPRPTVPLWLTPRRVLLVVVLGAGVAIGAYAFAARSSLFAVDGITVAGASSPVAREVKRALRPIVGESLVGLDLERVAALATSVPSVRAVRLERDFPDTLRVRVVPEQPVLVVRSGPRAWVVSERGRVLRELHPSQRPKGFPLLWAAGLELEPGARVADATVLHAARALGRLPDPFPLPISTARGTVDDLTLVLEGPRELELRLGPAEELGLKLEVAARVLAKLGATERERLDYVDVSVPERPVAGREPRAPRRAGTAPAGRTTADLVEASASERSDVVPAPDTLNPKVGT
jgi:cell division protein FtsQ